jgi:hypothetical protein
MTTGTHKGRREDNPGKMQFRQKGFFKLESEARAYQIQLKGQGKKTKVVKYTDGYGLYVMARHDFWKKDYIVGKWK